MKQPLPRNGQYELFTHNNKTYCFDDGSFDSANPVLINAPQAMWHWLRSMPGVTAMDHTNVAYYLTPQAYLLWKLKWL